MRATDGEGADYWIHVRVNDGGGLAQPDDPRARIVDARLDVRDKSASETNVGDFKNPGLYHLAVRVAREK